MDFIKIMPKNLLFIFLIILFSSLRLIATDKENQCKIRLPNTVNRYQNIVTPVISPDGSILFFDRKWHPNNLNGLKDEDDVWFSTKSSLGTWIEAENAGLPINSAESDVLFSISPCGNSALFYSSRHGGSFFTLKTRTGTSHPSGTSKTDWTFDELINIDSFYNKSGNFFGNLSADSRYLITALERNDSYGGLDLYVSTKISNNHYSEPKNLGNIINNKARQVSPFLAYDGKTLYFASDCASGNLDLYFSRRLDSTWTNWSKPEKLGNDINTEFDDSSIYLNLTGDSAYIVSSDTISRLPGIYLVCLRENARPLPYTIVSGKIIVVNNNDTSYNNNATINISFSDGYDQKIEVNKRNGLFTFIVPNGQEAVFSAESGGMFSEEKAISSKKLEKTIYIYTDVIFNTKVENLSFLSVFFNTASYELSNKDINLLQITAKQYLSARSNGNLLISGFADIRGTEEYNLELSRLRAEAVKSILTDSGIDPEKIKIEAKGKSEQISSFLQKNRRVDIRIID